MTPQTKTYEGMFLVDSGQPSFEAASEPIRAILQRRGSDVLALKPWEDRRLAYPVLGRKRGLYVLAYFKIDPSQMAELEHDCQLDERILRTLFLRRDRLSQEQIDAETPAMAAGHRHPPAAAEQAPAPEPAEPAGGQTGAGPPRRAPQAAPADSPDRRPDDAPAGPSAPPQADDDSTDR